MPGARFCSSCGGELGASAGPAQPVASRRITSVLFGDLVGFTELSESRDHEQVRELLSRYFDECRAIVARYGGVLEKFIGDAVMAVWGVPIAHEDDAERAVRAGLELIDTITAMGLEMRVGIVTGEVAVTIGAEQQGMVAGDAVNTASRVQTAATPGQVWVDETTRLLTSSAITYVDVGSHPMKGKADPVPLWSVRAVVAAVGGAQRADGLEAPLVGRESEMRLVKELFHRVEETGLPTLVVVSGEAGVGKSRLAWEFEKYIDGLSADVRWHTGRCLSYGEGVAFYALAEAIRTRLDNSSLELIVPDPDERAWIEPRIAALLGVGAVGSFQREDLFAAWATFLERVSGDGIPVALVIDDAQHADDGLLRFVEHLLAAGTFPCFVVLLARPGLLETNPALATNRRATVVHLEALPDRDMGRLLDGLVAGLGHDVRDALVQRSEGMPLFAVETVRSLIDRDLVVPRGGQYVLAGDDPLDLDAIGAPASLQALISARLDQLPPDQRRVIDRASIVGRPFPRDLIAALCPDVVDLDRALGSLVRLQLLRQETGRFNSDVGLYQFVQVVARQVAYATLSRRDRKAGHLAVVELLDDESAAIAAQHHLEAIDAVPEDPDVPALTGRAIELLRGAAERARSLGAPGEAAGHLRVALARVTDPVAQADIQLELAHALQDTEDPAAAIEPAEAARDAFDAVGDEIKAADAVGVLVYAIAVGRGDYETPATMAQERYDALRDREDATRVRLELARTLTRIKLRTQHGFGDHAAEHVRLAEQYGDDAYVAEAYVGFALHHMVSGMRGLGRVVFTAAAELARREHQLVTLSRALVNLNVTWASDDAALAREYGIEAVGVSRRAGVAIALSSAMSNLALACLVTGDWDDALAYADEAIVDEPLAELVRARIASARGTSWRMPSEMEDSRYAGDDLSLRCFVELNRALDAQVTSRPAGALARQAAETAYSVAGMYDDFTLIWMVATEVAWADGDRASLAELLALADSHSGAHPAGVRAQRNRIAGLLAASAGDDAAAETHLRDAIALSQQWHSEPNVALCRADLAAVLRRAGRADEAADQAQQAQEILERLGATRWADDQVSA